MNTKKILSLVLALVMVCSMMATLTVTASAADTRSRVIQKPCNEAYCVNGKIKCLTCDGNGKKTCGECGGTRNCADCGGTGNGTPVCICLGSGECIYCDENGKVDCVPCMGNGYTAECDNCGGDGIMEVNGSLITFDTNGTQIKESLTQPDAVENGSDFTAFPAVSAEGKTFLGWSTDKTAKTASYVNGNAYRVFADVTFYAIWKTGNECYLDLEASTTDIPGSKTIDQNYNLTVEEGDETNVTKVKLSWTISDINAVRTDNKVWDTTELKWVDVAGTPTVMDNGTATFKFENYSSVKVDAAAKFEALSDTGVTVAFDATTGTDGKITLDTANGSEIYSETNVPTGEITVTVTPSDDFFNDKTATTTAAKYGTYTVTISQAEEPVKLTFTRTTSYATLSYNGKTYNYGESFVITVPKNSVVSIVTTGSVGEEPTQSTLTVDGKTVTQYSETGYNLAWFPISNGAVITENTDIKTSSCILSGTAVTLADGSTKIIDDVTTEDKLMTFNFYEGKLDGNYPMYVMKHENVAADVITVTLDNGTVLEMCDWQQFFDMDQKTYFDIDVTHYQEAVGRNIMFVDNGAVTTARIVSATMETRVCTSYEIFTEYNKNFVANGILTVEPETYLQGVYTIGDDLKIDMEQYQKDVAAYGRYTYEEFAHIMTKDEFDKMNIADKKIAVGKGIVSEEWLFDLYRQWMPQYS